MVSGGIRVIYGDTDQMGFVYYANYLRYFEIGRTEYLRARGLRYREVEERFGVLLPVTEARVRYLAPARYDDLLTVETWIGEARRASARFAYRVHREGEVLATGETTHACLDRGGKLRRLPEELLSALGPAEPEPPPPGKPAGSA